MGVFSVITVNARVNDSSLPRSLHRVSLPATARRKNSWKNWRSFRLETSAANSPRLPRISPRSYHKKTTFLHPHFSKHPLKTPKSSKRPWTNPTTNFFAKIAF
jgi:hypothetical protein